MKKFLLFPWLFVSLFSFSQNNSCVNVNFETGDCMGWDVITGTVPSAPTQPYSFTQTGTSTCGSSVNHIIVTSGTDPNGGFPKVYPGGGGVSLQLGDGIGTGNGAARINQTFLVDSVNSTFTYHYAIVLNDAGHTQNEQPYFTFRIFNQNGDTVWFENRVVSSGGDPDFIAYAGGYYMDWRTQNVNLSAYAGQSVTVEFTAGDCTQSGHYGYAYIDADCLFTTGVNQFSFDNELLVYPNPIRNELKISVPNTFINYQVEIISITGQPIFKGNNTSKINTASFAQGIYFVKVWNDKQVIIKKVIKE
jgi:hypothetical protein